MPEDQARQYRFHEVKILPSTTQKIRTIVDRSYVTGAWTPYIQLAPLSGLKPEGFPINDSRQRPQNL